MHEIGANQTGEGERAAEDSSGGLSEEKQKESDKGDGDLDTHGVLGSAEEVADLEGLLDPAEEQLDLPATLVEFGNLFGRSIEIVGEDAQVLSGFCLDAGLADP